MHPTTYDEGSLSIGSVKMMFGLIFKYLMFGKINRTVKSTSHYSNLSLHKFASDFSHVVCVLL